MADQNQSSINELLNRINDLADGNNRKAAFENFINQLIEEKKFPDLTPEVREELKKDLLLHLDDFLAARIISALSDQDVLTFEKMLTENKSSEEIQKFTVDHIPDYINFLTNSLLEFRGVYLGLILVPPFIDLKLAESIKNAEPTKLPPAPVKAEQPPDLKKMN